MHPYVEVRFAVRSSRVCTLGKKYKAVNSPSVKTGDQAKPHLRIYDHRLRGNMFKLEWECTAGSSNAESWLRMRLVFVISMPSRKKPSALQTGVFSVGAGAKQLAGRLSCSSIAIEITPDCLHATRRIAVFCLWAKVSRLEHHA